MTEQRHHELLQTVPRPIAAMAKDYSAGYEGYLHSHARAQFLYAASGSMKLTTRFGAWIIPPRRAVWIPAKYPHQTGSIGELAMRTLYIREDALPPAAAVQPTMLEVSALLHELILRTVRMPVEYDESGQDAAIITALLGEIDWTPLSPVSLPALEDERLRELEKALIKNPGCRKTLEQWAKHLHISPRTLTRSLRREAHLSFQTWRDQIRTFSALPMLAEKRPLADIAAELGYESASSFTAMFKRITGRLPSRYWE